MIFGCQLQPLPASAMAAWLPVATSGIMYQDGWLLHCVMLFLFNS